MNCEQRMDEMQRFVDQDLTQAEEESLLAHIKQCPECTASFEQLQRLSAELSLLPMVSPPFSIVDSILPRLAELDAQQAAIHLADLKTANWRRKALFSLKIGAGFVAAAVVFSLIAVNLAPSSNKEAGQTMNNAIAFTADALGKADSGDGLEGAHAEETPMAAAKGIDSSSIRQDKSNTINESSADTIKKTTPTGTSAQAPVIADKNTLDVPFSGALDFNSAFQSLASDDGNFIGVVQQQMVLIQTPDGNRSFTSSVQWKPTDVISLVKWEDNRRLIYEVKTDKDKVKRYVIDVIQKTELEQKL